MTDNSNPSATDPATGLPSAEAEKPAQSQTLFTAKKEKQ